MCCLTRHVEYLVSAALWSSQVYGTRYGFTLIKLVLSPGKRLLATTRIKVPLLYHWRYFIG